MRWQNLECGPATGTQRPATDESPSGDWCRADTSTTSWGKANWLEPASAPATRGLPTKYRDSSAKQTCGKRKVFGRPNQKTDWQEIIQLRLSLQLNRAAWQLHDTSLRLHGRKL